MRNSTESTLRLGLLVLLLTASSAAQVIEEQQTDTASGAAVNGGDCSAAVCDSGQTDTLRTMDEGGTAGTSEVSETQSADNTNRMFAFFEDSDGLGTACDAGTATVRLDITTGNANYVVNEVCILQGTTQVGSLTGLTTDLSVDRSFSVTTSSDSGCTSNAVRVLICGDIGPMGGHGNESVGITPSLIHDIPGTAATTRRVIMIQ